MTVACSLHSFQKAVVSRICNLRVFFFIKNYSELFHVIYKGYLLILVLQGLNTSSHRGT